MCIYWSFFSKSALLSILLHCYILGSCNKQVPIMQIAKPELSTTVGFFCCIFWNIYYPSLRSKSWQCVESTWQKNHQLIYLPSQKHDSYLLRMLIMNFHNCLIIVNLIMMSLISHHYSWYGRTLIHVNVELNMSWK